MGRRSKTDKPTLTHAALWRAIDQLAADQGMTASGLARKAGLDPTAFNKSKRVDRKTGRDRWPSTQSIAKCLEVTGVTLPQFCDLVVGSDGK